MNVFKSLSGHIIHKEKLCARREWFVVPACLRILFISI